MEKKVSILNNRSIIKISGNDSLLFLNNIISSDLEKGVPDGRLICIVSSSSSTFGKKLLDIQFEDVSDMIILIQK